MGSGMDRLTSSNKLHLSIFPQDSKKVLSLGRLLVARFFVNYLRVTLLILNLSLAGRRLKLQFGVVNAQKPRAQTGFNFNFNKFDWRRLSMTFGSVSNIWKPLVRLLMDVIHLLLFWFPKISILLVFQIIVMLVLLGVSTKWSPRFSQTELLK